MNYDFHFSHRSFLLGLVCLLPAISLAAADLPQAATPTTQSVIAASGTVVNPITGTPSLAAAEFGVAGGETTVTLDIGFGIRAVPASRVTVPARERLRIVAPAIFGGGTDAGTGQYIWTKDGKAIAAPNTSVLTLNSVQPSDAGTYTCLYSTPTTLPQPSQALVLAVGPTARMLNVSVRGILPAGPGQSFVAGFVVAAGSQPKKTIVRAIGPSLARFGVPNVLARPILRIFDSRGAPYSNGYVYPAVVGGPTYESDLAESLASVGAFPTTPGSADAVLLLPFAAGAYTAQVTSADGTGGDVLLEIYEVP